ncbi:MAG: putative transposase, partial [Pseudomonadota bacterium]
DCQGVAGLGVLLAIPSLVATGMLDIASEHFRGWTAAFYGVRSVFLCLVLMALQRIRNPEQLRHHSPVDLGRVLGLDRAPEVKTLREKVESLSKQKQSETFMRELALRRVQARPEAMGFLYVDGHVRVYSGKIKLGKMHVTRMRLSMPATADHWVNDRDGDPLLVITSTPTAALAKEMLTIANEARLALGDRRATVVFDRGGWSPKLFADLIALGFDVLTYRKGRVPKVRRGKFKLHEAVFEGRSVAYQLAERTARFKYPGGVLVLREVVRLCDDGKHQTSIVTSRKELAAVEVAYRMFERWRQENFFKYMGTEFGIDALWTHGTESADPEREVPNPERKDRERDLLEARAEVTRLERVLGAAAADNDESMRPTMRGFKIANGKVGQQLREARQRVTQLRDTLKAIPKRVSARTAANGKPVVRLKTEAKRLTDTIKSVAYQAETALFRMVRAAKYARADDDGRKLIASAMDLPGDIQVTQGELRIILAPAASPNRTRAIARLCEELTATQTIYPGTQLRVSYAIRDA